MAGLKAVRVWRGEAVVQVRLRVWLEENGRLVVGEGLCALLEAIAATGSINQAARQLGMSYRQAWERLHKVESRLQVVLVERHVGGEGGGGAYLTPQGEELLRRYRGFYAEAAREVEHLSQKYFG